MTKKLYLPLLMAIVVALFSSCKKMGPLSADYFTVTPQVLEAVGGKVPATINGKFPEKYFKKKAVVEVTPVLKWNGGEAKGQSAVFQGEKVEGNDQTISYKVGGSYTMKTSFDYVPEMAKSELWLEFKAKVGKKEVVIPAVKVADGVISTSELVNNTLGSANPALGEDAFQRIIKEKHPNARVVFIGPCASKKLEAMREDIRSDVDFVITFEELMGIFQANNIEFSDLQDDTGFNHGATASGRGYGVAGGVAKAVTDCIREMAPELGEIKTDHAEGLVECKKMLTLAKLGKRDGYLLEGMACPGGCVGGAGTLTNIPKGAKAEQEFAAKSEFKVSTEDKIVFEKLGKYTKK